MSTSDKLLYLNDTKVAIRDAIVARGVDVPTGTPFRDYAGKITSIDVYTPEFTYILPLTSDLLPTTGSGTPTFSHGNGGLYYEHSVSGWTAYSANTPIFDNGGLRILPICINLFGVYTSGVKVISIPEYSWYYGQLSFVGTGTLSWVSATDFGNGSLVGTGTNTRVSIVKPLNMASGDVTFTITGDCRQAQFDNSYYIGWLQGGKIPPFTETLISPALNFIMDNIPRYTGTIYMEFFANQEWHTIYDNNILKIVGSSERVLFHSSSQSSQWIYKGLNTPGNIASSKVWNKIAMSYTPSTISIAIDGVTIAQAPNASGQLYALNAQIQAKDADYTIRNFKTSPYSYDLKTLQTITT